MAVKVCCVDTCTSSSMREEDVGVTYHKFPKDETIRTKWTEVTRLEYNTQAIQYVCSRHFCKSDFQIYKDSKYILKSDAVPSIFSWTMEVSSPATETKIEDVATPPENIESQIENKPTETINTSNETKYENLESIKESTDVQEKDINNDAKSDVTYCEEIETETVSQELNEPTLEVVNNDDGGATNKQEAQEEKFEVASSVMDMILSESEAKLAVNKDDKAVAKRKICSGEKGNITALSVGSRVEAKDFGEYWHPAEVVEVDFDEMEVLVHYEDAMKRHDEWISVSSPRLRPRGSGPSNPPTRQATPLPDTVSGDTSKPASPAPVSASIPFLTPMVVKEELKERCKMKFDMGERCLARWRDNRRFIATVNADLGGGQYEIIFDDGVKWTCNVIRLSKLKDGSKKDPLTIDTSGNPATCSTLSPIYGPGPSDAGSVTPNTPLPANLPFNTHLFDPTRDYLGSKSERREMKRKLNIKEIFNIGQKKKKVEPTPKKIVKPKPVVKKKMTPVKKIKEEPEVKKEIPDAVASIIGTVQDSTDKYKAIKEENEIKTEMNSNPDENLITLEDIQDSKGTDINIDKTSIDIEVTTLDIDDSKLDMDDCLDLANSETLSAPESQDIKREEEPALDEETKLKKFEEDETKHKEVIHRIKEVIIKLEDGISQSQSKIEQLEVKAEIKDTSETAENTQPLNEEQKVLSGTKEKKSLSKIKKVKKERLLQEKRVKSQVEKVQSELEDMRRQMEEMKKKMAEELAKQRTTEMPESFLLPGEWCCKWVNGQPVGTVSEMEHETKVNANNKPVLPRRSVQVVDKRLPPGWTKHMVRRSLGHSAGKWDVVLISPDDRRFHTKTDMKHYLEDTKDESLKAFEHPLLDFGVHLKLSRRMGWYTTTPDGEQEPPVPLPAGTLCTTSPLVRKKQLSLKKTKLKELKLEKKKKKKKLKLKLKYAEGLADGSMPGTSSDVHPVEPMPPENVPLEDGFVYVGCLKVQIIENLLRCPAEGCFKNFRNNTLLKMHIKHYHRELTKQLGATPKVLDLAYARTRPTEMEMRKLKLEAQKNTFRVKLRKLPKKFLEPKPEVRESLEPKTEPGLISVKEEKVPRSQDSPKLRHALNKLVKRPKVLLPVRRTELSETVVSGTEVKDEVYTDDEKLVEPKIEVPHMEVLDFETAISTHTVTKPTDLKRKERKMKFASISKLSEDEDWFGANSDMDTRSSNPRSGTPDSKLDQKLVSSESNEDQKDSNYLYTETGERIKIVHMKREEIINCHCGFREEDGLMVQCELCFCWQHALCHNIQRESEVPEKYTCSICLNPRRGRRSQRFLHDQDRLYEGLLPGAKPCESLRRSHELSGNLHRIQDVLHALRVKYNVATQKNHPKLYLWAQDWEAAELTMTQERLNSDYSDLNIMISGIGKENLPLKPEDVKDMALELRGDDIDSDRYSQKDSQLGSQALLSGLLSSPGALDLPTLPHLPISTTELEKLAKTVQAEQESQRVMAPQPEAAIENSVCRERLLKHIQRCQALIDARLDSIEAQVAELESQDPSFEDDETAEFFPRTKQTIQMMMRDLDTMEELGVIT